MHEKPAPDLHKNRNWNRTSKYLIRSTAHSYMYNFVYSFSICISLFKLTVSCSAIH